MVVIRESERTCVGRSASEMRISVQIRECIGQEKFDVVDE